MGGSSCSVISLDSLQVEELLRQQLALLEELEEKRRELEQRWRDTHQTGRTPQEAAPRQSTALPEPPAEVPAFRPNQS